MKFLIQYTEILALNNTKYNHLLRYITTEFVIEIWVYKIAAGKFNFSQSD